MAATPNASGNLRAAAQDQLEQKQAAWAAKRWTWVIDDKEGCVAGEIIKEAGNDITVRLTSGQVRVWVAASHPETQPALDAHTLVRAAAAPRLPLPPGGGRGTGAHRVQRRH